MLNENDDVAQLVAREVNRRNPSERRRELCLLHATVEMRWGQTRVTESRKNKAKKKYTGCIFALRSRASRVTKRAHAE